MFYEKKKKSLLKFGEKNKQKRRFSGGRGIVVI